MSEPAEREPADRLRSRIRDTLERERRRVQAEIQAYPRPVAGCDAQFNHLLARRAGLQQELAELRAAGDQELPARLARLARDSGEMAPESRQALLEALTARGEWLLIDLREERRPELLRAFVRLYDRTFRHPAEREDPAAWPRRLWGPPRPEEPRARLLVALPGPEPDEVAGGLLCEYYPASRCGLLAYLVVDPRCRRRGLARALTGAAVEGMRRDAAAGGGLRALFAESEVAGGGPGGAMPPAERQSVMARLGGFRVDLPYVQPELSEGSGRVRHLALLAFRWEGGPDLPDADTARAFLEEYYRSLGVPEPGADPDWICMARALDAGIAFRNMRVEGGEA